MAQISSSSTSAERGGGRARGDCGEVGGGRSSRRGKRGLIAGPTSSLVQRPVLFGILARRHPRLCHRPAVMFALVATAHASTATVPTGEQPAPSPSGTEPPSCFSPLAPSSQRRGSENIDVGPIRLLQQEYGGRRAVDLPFLDSQVRPVRAQQGSLLVGRGGAAAAARRDGACHAHDRTRLGAQESQLGSECCSGLLPSRSPSPSQYSPSAHEERSQFSAASHHRKSRAIAASCRLLGRKERRAG